LKSWNACYHSVQNLLSSSLLSKNIKIEIYRNIILTLNLYGCETWSLTLKEKRRLWISENRVLRRIFEPKRNKVTGEWRKLHNDEHNDLFSSLNIVRVIKSRRMRWAWHVACMGRAEVCIGFWWGHVATQRNAQTQHRTTGCGPKPHLCMSCLMPHAVGLVGWFSRQLPTRQPLHL
jgi:hypothetical protein